MIQSVELGEEEQDGLGGDDSDGTSRGGNWRAESSDYQVLSRESRG